MAVKIGKNTSIGDNNAIGKNAKVTTSRDSFLSRHPLLTGLISSFIIGFGLLFSFWDNVVKFVEDIIK